MSDEKTSSLTFPCDFPIKIVGKSSLDFQAAVLSIIRKHAPDLGEAAVVERHSKDSTYLSLTVTVHAHSQAQLDAIYQDLSAEPSVIMAL
ncbi:MAG: DUF493 domain-containing protein [Gammaproteobacteria bacterium]